MTTDFVSQISFGDKVTILTRFGNKVTGKAVMKSEYGGWVLNLGGRNGTPGLADNTNIVKVSKVRK